MTENVNGMTQDQDTIAQPAKTETSEKMTSDERTFRQNEVNDIVKRAKQDAVETYKRVQSEQPNYFNQKYPDTNTSRSENVSQDEVRRLAAEEIKRHREDWVREANEKSQAESAQKLVQSFVSKLPAGRDKYKDFDQVTGDVQYSAFPRVLHLLDGYVDNTADVLYDLGRDRIKMANLEQLAKMSPDDAIVQVRRLSQSIKDNEAAAKTRSPNDPLSQIRPSHTGTDSGVMSVKDYRKKYRV